MLQSLHATAPTAHRHSHRHCSTRESASAARRAVQAGVEVAEYVAFLNGLFDCLAVGPPGHEVWRSDADVIHGGYDGARAQRCAAMP